jgi:outer membrane receptor protein involved in Fe transport
VDLTVRNDPPKKHWGFAASVRNLFDADVREPSLRGAFPITDDLPLPGRNYWLQVRYQL